MSAANDAMNTLTAQWYNAVVTGLQLSPDQFQLYQGPNSMASTSQDMWNIFSAVPPNSINNFYNPSQANNFASDYNLILNALTPGSDSSFQSCMGDYYSQWMTYVSANPPSPINATTLSQLFNNWAVINAPGQAGCVTALTKSFINPITYAINIFQAANGNYAFNETITTLKAALAGGAGKSFGLDTSTASSNTSHTWASGSTSVAFDLFSFGASASYDNLTTQATASALNIQVSFKKVTTFAAGPYSQKNANDPILSQYSPWFVGAVLSLAYTTQDNTVWNNQSATTWNTAFGPAGFLQRMATAIVVADGVDITITSTASFDSSDQTTITASAKTGFWPFFQAQGQGGSKNTITFNDAGQFTATTSIPAGNPQVIGVLQTSLASLYS